MRAPFFRAGALQRSPINCFGLVNIGSAWIGGEAREVSANGALGVVSGKVLKGDGVNNGVGVEGVMQKNASV